MSVLSRTPLHEEHLAAGAKMVPFAGWEMPVQYGGILDEVRAVRTGAGLFDVSHMARFRLLGEGALAAAQAAVTSDVAQLPAGQAGYALLLTDGGGIADDLFVYGCAGGEREVAIVANAANAAKDRGLLEASLGGAARLVDETASTGMVALQGPEARALAQQLTEFDLSSLTLHRWAELTLAGVASAVSCTGYTGEDGFEIVCAAAEAPSLWRGLLEAGARPCGLGARDVLRLEAGYPLWGHEIDEETTPAEAGLARFLAKEKPTYRGKLPAEARAEEGPDSVLVGLRATGRRFPREGVEVRLSGQPAGRITSGTFSPTLGVGIAIARVPNPERLRYAQRVSELVGLTGGAGAAGAEIEVEAIRLPFHRRGR